MPIQDVTPLPDSATLIATLYIRGVTIEDIFGRYYELEAQADARADEIFGNDEEGQHGRKPLTVGDAQLAGLATLPSKPQARQTF